MERSTKILTLAVVTALAASCGAFGCAAAQPPRELVDARMAYHSAATSPNAGRVQPEIAAAQRALGRAEAAFEDSPSSDSTRDLSYLASRKAGSARAKANALSALEEKDAALIELRSLVAQRQLDQKGDLAKSRAQIESERQARLTAEKKARDALMTIAGMKAEQNERGLVLTLSGSVLFATGKSAILPAARVRLDEAAKALQEDGRSITIVGHTDSVGTDEANEKLSMARAESVRTYLVGRGLPAAHVTAEGAGESKPISDNDTAEGRANNRRVEIILENSK